MTSRFGKLEAVKLALLEVLWVPVERLALLLDGACKWISDKVLPLETARIDKLLGK
jgi:hypothetical protein